MKYFAKLDNTNKVIGTYPVNDSEASTEQNGINFLIIGSLAIKQPDYFKEIAATYPNKLYVSIDDLKGHSMIGGWIEKSGYTTEEVLNVYNF